MDFEINTDGVITKYIGLGGDVALPEDGQSLESLDVLDGNQDIKTLYLPKGFLGVRNDYSNRMIVKFDPETGTATCTAHCGDMRHAKPSDQYVYVHQLRHLHLPALERFEVHPDNPAYSSKDGVLYSKDFKTLLICPPKLKGKVSTHSKTKEIVSRAFTDCTLLTEIELKWNITSLDDQYQHLFGGELPEYVRIIGLNVTRLNCWTNIKTIKSKTTLDRVALVMPNLPFAYEVPFYKLRLALGYCVNPEYYDEVSDTYKNFIKKNRCELLGMAKVMKAQEIIDFFEAQDKRSRAPKSNSSQSMAKFIKPLQPRKAVLLLEDRICNGSDEEVARVLEVTERFAMLARALGLACRYGSLKKVELLCRHTNFNYDNVSTANVNYFGSVTGIGVSQHWADYSLIPVIDYFRPEFVGASNALAIDESEGEVVNAKVLPQKTRAEILEFLYTHKVINDQDLDRLFFHSLMFGNCTIAKTLKKLGASLDDYGDFIEATDQRWPFKVLFTALFEEHPEAVMDLAKYAKSDGLQLKVNPSTKLDAFYEKPKLLANLIAKTNLGTATFNAILKYVMANDRADLMSVLLDSNRISLKQSKELMEQSLAQGSNELTSMLMEYNNTKAKTEPKPKRKKSSLSL